MGMVQKVLKRNVDMVVGDRLSSTYFEENIRTVSRFRKQLFDYIRTINRLAFFSGLILTSIAEKERQEFEFRLNLIEMYLKEKLHND